MTARDRLLRFLTEVQEAARAQQETGLHYADCAHVTTGRHDLDAWRPCDCSAATDAAALGPLAKGLAEEVRQHEYFPTRRQWHMACEACGSEFSTLAADACDFVLRWATRLGLTEDGEPDDGEKTGGRRDGD